MTPATILEHDGIKQPITEWALDYGITPKIIIGRVERGVSIADAITTPMKTGHRGQRLPIFSRKQMPRTAQEASMRRHTFNGRTLTLNEWAQELRITYNALSQRIHRLGSIEAAVTWKPMTRAELARESGVDPRTVESRLRRGWPRELALTEPPGARMGRFAHGRPGVSSDFAPSEGTGAGSTLQESTNITFSREA